MLTWVMFAIKDRLLRECEDGCVRAKIMQASSSDYFNYGPLQIYNVLKVACSHTEGKNKSCKNFDASSCIDFHFVNWKRKVPRDSYC